MFERLAHLQAKVSEEGKGNLHCMYTMLIPGCLTVTHLLSLSRLLEDFV